MTRSADRSARRLSARSLLLLARDATIATLRRCNTNMYGIGVVLEPGMFSPRTRHPMNEAARAMQGW